ncbi:hypothetical protein NMY22_g10853 [Coprinellus aureogranulatus]|nr:hypothetical protein NMY22_g10853 [Coprinellus aureogranulatus]
MSLQEPALLEENEKRLGGVENGPESATLSSEEVGGEGEGGTPEGGLRAWGTVLGGFFVQFCGFAYCTSFGVFQDYYTRIYLSEASPSAISWIGSISAFLSIALSLVTGPLYDRGYLWVPTAL